MDRIESINSQLERIMDDINVLIEKKKELELERASILFDEFCNSIGVSVGDILESTNALYKGTRLVLCGPDTQFDNWVTVRKLKKDGTAYTSTNSLAKGLLKNYKVVGHIDL